LREIFVEEVDEHELHVERVAALDLGKAVLEACVRVPHESRPGRRMQEIRGFATTTSALLQMADWFRRWGVTRVVMESSLKGRGRATPDVGLLVTGLLAFPGWVRTNASEGWVSRLDRRSTRAAGLALTPTPSGA